MADRASHLRDIIIGAVLVVIGGATLLHTLNIFMFNEEQVILWAVYGLWGCGGLLLILYMFQYRSVWMLMLALCMLFIGAATYVLNFQRDLQDLIPVSLFILTALAFFVHFIVRPAQWWSMLVGWICLGLAGTVFASLRHLSIPFLPGLPVNTVPPLMLFTGVSLGFLFVWMMSMRERWWSLLTAGQIIAVASAIIAEALRYPDVFAPMYLFLISGISFLLVWSLRTEDHRLQWAIYPAAVLISFASFLYFVTFWLQNSRLVLSLIFLFIGLLFIFNYFRPIIWKRAATPHPTANDSFTRRAPVDDDAVVPAPITAAQVLTPPSSEPPAVAEPVQAEESGVAAPVDYVIDEEKPEQS